MKFKILTESVRLFIQRQWSKDMSLILICIIVTLIAGSWFLPLMRLNVLSVVFAKFSSETIWDVLVIISFGLFVIIFFYLFYRYKVILNFRSWFYFTVFAATYVLFRLWSGVTFYGFSFLQEIYYIDLLAFWLLPLIPFSKEERKNWIVSENIKHQCPISNDDYFGDSRTDIYQRKNYAKQIVENINKIRIEKAFAIGIVGKWGSGKSVFLDFLEENFDTKTNIIIRFNPWRYSSDTDISDSFFKEYEKSIAKYYPGISSAISNYATAIVDIDDGIVSRIIKPVSNLFRKNATYENLYIKVQCLLKNINRKVIVFIDDLDRLNNDEIKAVMKIIRNSANFPNTVFFVAYDHDHIIKVFTNPDNVGNRNYLEKIFQIEVPLPSHPEQILIDTAKVILKERIPKDAVNFINDFRGVFFNLDRINHTSDSVQIQYFTFFISNVRDLVRFSNSVNLIYQNRIGEVNMQSFIILELLKTKFFAVYDLLKSKVLLKQQLKNLVPTGFYEIDSIAVDTMLKNICDKLYNGDVTKNMIVPVLRYLYPDQRIKCDDLPMINKPDPVGVNQVRNHILYFSSEFFFNISKKEYEELVLNKEFSEILDKTKEWIDDGRFIDLIKFLNNTIDHYHPESYYNAIGIKLYYELTDYDSVFEEVVNSTEFCFSAIKNLFSVSVQQLARKENEFVEAFKMNVFYNSSIPIEKRLKLVISFLSSPLDLEFNKVESSSLQNVMMAIIDSYMSEGKLILYEDFKIITEALDRYPDKTKTAEVISRVKESIKTNTDVESNLKRFLMAAGFEKWVLNRTIFPEVNAELIGSFLENLPDYPEVYTARTIMEIMAGKNLETVVFPQNVFIVHSDSKKDIFKSSSVSAVDPDVIKTIAFKEHAWRKHIIKADESFELYEWIAHTQEITNEEAVNGGQYTFVRNLNLDFDIRRIIECKLEFCVDDYLEMKINSQLVYKQKQEEHFGANLTSVQVGTDKLVSGMNRIEMIVTNTKGKSTSTFKTNPYALVYRFTFKYNL